MSSGTWRDTLFVWCGTLEQTTTGEERQRVEWRGTWIGCEDCGDACTAPTPAAFGASDMTFCVAGWREEGPSSSDADDEKAAVFKANLTDGPGWDLDNGAGTTKYKDHEHTVYLQGSPWGSVDDQSTLIVAKGTNEFGPFLSAGYRLPDDNKIMLARRYLDEGDQRMQWTVQELYQRIQQANQTVQVSVAPNVTWRRAPWRTIDLHASEKAFDQAMRAQTSKRKRARDDEAASSCPVADDALAVDLNISSKRFSPKLSIDTSTKYAKLTSHVKWVEQCSGCGKAIKLGNPPSCIRVEANEVTPGGSSRSFGQALYCSAKCSTTRGAKAWAVLGRDYQQTFPDSGNWLESRASDSFWDAILSNKKAAKLVKDGGWKKNDKGHMRLDLSK